MLEWPRLYGRNFCVLCSFALMQMLPIFRWGLNKCPGTLDGRFCADTTQHAPNTSILDQVTAKIIGCAIEVHRVLGPDMLESVYRECMLIEMLRNQLDFVSEERIPIRYKGELISSYLKVDLLVEGCVVVELKAVEQIHPIHLAQVISYLKLTGCPAGLLVNFSSTSLRAGVRRLNHPDLYKTKTS